MTIEKTILSFLGSKKHLAGQHDQSVHGNRFRTIEGKPELVHVGGKTEENYDTFHMDSLTIEERSNKLNDLEKPWLQSLSEEDKSTVSLYTGTYYESINKHLRMGAYTTDSKKNVLSNVQNLLLKNTLKQPITVHRGIDDASSSSDNPYTSISNLFKQSVGKTYEDKGFCSTSLNENDQQYASKKVIFHISLPIGMHGAYIQSISQYSNEYEYLLPHSTKYQVDKVESKIGNAGYEIHHVYLSGILPKDEKATIDTFLVKHLPGQHDQSTHGRRFKIPGDEASKVVAGPKIKKPKVEKPKKIVSSDNYDTSSFDKLDFLKQKELLENESNKEFFPKLTPKENDSIKTYTTYDYVEMNDFLRKGASISSDLKEKVEHTQSGLLKGSLKQPITVHRAITDDSNLIGLLKKSIGKEFTDKAFVSTTIADFDHKFGKKNIVMHIALPKGIEGGYIATISETPGEYEYLLPHDTKFKVKSIKSEPKPFGAGMLHHVYLDAIPQKNNSKNSFDTFLVKHLPGQHDQSTHGNRFKIIAGKPKITHIGGKLGKIEYDHEGKPIIPTTELPPKITLPDYSHDDIYALKSSLHQDQEDWKPSVVQKSAIKRYTGIAYKSMNKTLRNPSPYYTDPSIQKSIDALQAGLIKNETKRSFTVHRGIGDTGNVLSIFKDSVGKKFVDKGFVSSSIHEKKAFSTPIKMHIEVPKGMQGAYIEKFSGSPGENEFLFPHGTSFKVKGVFEKEDGFTMTHHILLEAIPHIVPKKVKKPKATKYIGSLPVKKIFNMRLEKNIFEIKSLIKHLSGQHDQSTHGNRFRTIAGKPRLVHVGGKRGKIEYDKEGKPITPSTDLPPIKTELDSFNTKDALSLSEVNDSEKKFNKLLDVKNEIEGAGQTKGKIARQIAERLKDKPEFQALVADWKNVSGQTHPMFEKTMDNNEVAAQLVKSWQISSGDSFPLSVALQNFTAKEFNLKETSNIFGDANAKAQEQWGKHEIALRQFVRAQYDNTQDYLKKNNIKEILLYRGMGFDGKAPKEVSFDGIATKREVRLQPASAFATDSGVSYDLFSSSHQYSMLVGAKIPAERIMGSCQSGYGCKAESEMIVLGGKETMWQYAWENTHTGGKLGAKKKMIEASKG